MNAIIEKQIQSICKALGYKDYDIQFERVEVATNTTTTVESSQVGFAILTGVWILQGTSVLKLKTNNGVMLFDYNRNDVFFTDKVTRYYSGSWRIDYPLTCTTENTNAYFEYIKVVPISNE